MENLFPPRHFIVHHWTPEWNPHVTAFVLYLQYQYINNSFEYLVSCHCMQTNFRGYDPSGDQMKSGCGW